MQCTGPARKLSYGTIFKAIDAEMNAVGVRKNNPCFFIYTKINMISGEVSTVFAFPTKTFMYKILRMS